MELDSSHFIAALRRIPLFEGLKPKQGMALLKACERRSIAVREQLCQIGEGSEEMFILLSGKLSVRNEDGTQIALIEPIAPMGEMGIFTGEPRSATVLASEPSTLLVLGKSRLNMLLRQNPEVELVISRNLIQILSQRLRAANHQEIRHLTRLMKDQDAGAEAQE